MKEHPLLTLIENRFHEGRRKDTADNLQMKLARYGHYANLRRMLKDWHIVLLRRKYGKAHNAAGGLTDTQILDAFEKIYTREKIQELIDGE